MRPLHPWTVLHLFSPHELEAAYEALRECHAAVTAAEGKDCPGKLARALLPYYRRRGGGGGGGGPYRHHVELTLERAAEDVLPPALEAARARLCEAAACHVRERLTDGRLAAQALEGLGRRSVVRLLAYERGVGCRPHADPGLCTALLLGSDGGGGLELHDGPLPAHLAGAVGRMGDYSDEAGSGRLDRELPWRAPRGDPGSDADALVMSGALLPVVAGPPCPPAVLHRVRDDWCGAADGPDAQTLRYNLVVELRPPSAKKWFRRRQQLS